MTATQVLAGLAAVLVAVGIGLISAGWRGWQPELGWLLGRAGRCGRPGTGAPALSPQRLLRTASAIGGGLVVGVLTGWPVLGVAVGGAVLGLPAILGADARAAAQIDRVEAVAEWARRVADVVAIGVGLEQSLTAAARTAPEPIAGEAAALAARISAGMPSEVALRRFADEVADPAADLVVAALILAVRRRGPGVAAALTAIAESVGEEVAARRRIEADRAKPRATARAVTVITVLVVGVGLLNRGYTQPYATLIGQLVLAATLGFFAAALWWMHSMTVVSAPARILASQEDAR